MSGKETKIEQTQRIIKHKRKKEEFRQAMKVWDALNRDPEERPILVGYQGSSNADAASYYCPYVPLSSNGKLLMIGLEITA